MTDQPVSGLFTPFTVSERFLENPRTVSLVCKEALPSAQPGQYAMVWLPGLGEKPFSIANNGPLMLTVSAVGKISQAIFNLQVGERFWARGPLGQGYQTQGKRHVLVGGGYGAAPLVFLARRLRERGDEVSVCLGARSREDLLLVSSFESLHCQVALTTEDGSIGLKGLVSLPAEACLKEGADTLYACGPIGMLIAVADLARKYHANAQLSFEGMIRCAIGLCGSCELPEAVCQQVGLPAGWLVCHDGPVVVLNYA